MAKKAGTTNGAMAEPQPESLDKVRDILFGGQMRAVESRLQGLESRLLKGQESLRNDFSKQMAALDASLQREVQGLTERLGAERSRRTEEIKGLAAELKEALRALEKRHLRLEETSGMADADLREGILQQSKALTADIARLSERLGTELTNAVRDLRAEKLSITTLAGAFGEMASWLTAEAEGKGTQRPRG
jgi:predicted  nucleic acid-binding Zn-ribbon protein